MNIKTLAAINYKTLGKSTDAHFMSDVMFKKFQFETNIQFFLVLTFKYP